MLAADYAIIIDAAFAAAAVFSHSPLFHTPPCAACFDLAAITLLAARCRAAASRCFRHMPPAADG